MWDAFSLVWPNILGVRVRFSNFIVTYLSRLSTLVLEVQPYLIILFWPHFGYFWPFLGLSGLFLAWVGVQKFFLKPINVDYQFWFWNYSPMFSSFGPFLGIWGYFWGTGQVEQLFWNLLTYPNNFCFGSMWFL